MTDGECKTAWHESLGIAIAGVFVGILIVFCVIADIILRLGGIVVYGAVKIVSLIMSGFNNKKGAIK